MRLPHAVCLASCLALVGAAAQTGPLQPRRQLQQISDGASPRGVDLAGRPARKRARPGPPHCWVLAWPHSARPAVRCFHIVDQRGGPGRPLGGPTGKSAATRSRPLAEPWLMSRRLPAAGAGR